MAAHASGARRARRLAAAAAAAVVLACAHPVPPTGGPEDRSPPEIVDTSPRLYERRVPLDAPLRITFSERMDRGSVEDGLIVRPEIDASAMRWKGDTLVVAPPSGWAPGTSYVVLLRRSIADTRRNTMAEPAFIVFSTGDSLATAYVAGKVERIGVSSAPALVLAFGEPSRDTTAIDPSAAVAVAEPDAEGRFLLPGLRSGASYEVGAFLDVNENRAFDGRTDLYCRAPSPVVPDTSGGPRDVLVTLVFADEPGSIQGASVDSVCLALAASRARALAHADSLTARRDSLAAARAHAIGRADSLVAEAAAPPRAGRPPDSLRAAADSIRARADAFQPPDSAAIARALVMTEGELSDSIYCARPVIARFWSARDSSARFETTSFGGAYGLANVPPGAYHGIVFRDLDGDGAYAFGVEPGVADTLTVSVPPGRPAVVDTLRLDRPEGWTAPATPAPRKDGS